jgi:TIR domain
MSGHVFISASADDREYAQRLARHLRQAGLETWSDDGPDSPERWTDEIRPQIDTCSAFVPVMSAPAQRSGSVDREVARAQDMGKPILPLLISGKPLPRLADLPHEDVAGSGMPRPRYVAALRATLGDRLPVTPTPAPSVGGGSGMTTGAGLVAAAATVIVLVATVTRLIEYPAWWLEVLGVGAASGVACLTAFRQRAWLFPATVAVIVSLIGMGDVALNVVVGVFDSDQFTIWSVASIVAPLAAAAWSYNRHTYFVDGRVRAVAWLALLVVAGRVLLLTSYGYGWWYALLTTLVTYVAYLVLLFQASWDANRASRGAATLGVAVFGGFTSLAWLSNPAHDVRDGFVPVALFLFGLIALAARRRDGI